MSELLKSTFIINTTIKDAFPSPTALSSISSSGEQIDADFADTLVLEVSVNPDTEEVSTEISPFENRVNTIVRKAIDPVNKNVTSLESRKQSAFAINAGDYGAKGDLVYEEVTYNTIRIARNPDGTQKGTDTTANIQAALNAAGALVPQDVNLPYEAAVRVIIPAGKYIVTKTLIVPSNVILDCEYAVFFNFLSDDWAPVISGRRHSHATKIKVHANRKSGVEWGDRTGGGVRCDSYIDSIWVEHGGVEYQSTLPPNRQKCGLRLFGLWFRIDRIEIKEANIGLDIYQASDVLCPSVFLMGCSTACRLESAEQIIFPCVALDTNFNTGFQIDNSGNVLVNLTAFVNSDGFGTAMDEILKVGAFSGTPCKDIHISAVAVSTGGRMLSIANCIDSTFNLFASNARLFSQTSGSGQANSHWNAVNWTPVGSTESISGGLLAHDLGMNYQPYGNEGNPVGVVKYGANLSGVLEIRLLSSEGVRATDGTVYGLLTVNGQIPPRPTQTLAATSVIQVGHARIVPITSAAAITLTSSPAVAPGTEGQVIYLSNVGGFSITLNVSGRSLVIATKRVAPLIFFSGAWLIAN